MGPFFALGHLLGGAPWLVQRLWLALILFLAAWGAVRLMDELAGPARGLPHVVAGLLFLLNPYVVVFTARTSITLLGYAALAVVVGGCATGAAGAWVALAGGVRADRDRVGRRRERGRDGVGPARSGVARGIPVVDGRGGPAARLELRLADRAGDGAGVGMVGDAAAGPVALRRGLPALHGAARDDLGDDVTARVAAAYGLLDLVPRRRVRRRSAPVLRGRRRAAVRAPRGARRAAGPCAGARWIRDDPGPAVRAVRPGAGADRPDRDDGRLPGGHAAPPRVELYVQQLHTDPVPAHHVQGGAAGGAGRGHAGRVRRDPVASRGVRRVGAGGLLAAGPRPSRGRPAAVGADPVHLARGGGPRGRARRRRARGGAARSAVRVLRLGRHDRPDPADARRHAGRHPQRGRLRRPPRDRPAVERRRARPATPRRPRPVGPAARPARRAGGRRRRRRRPRAQRRRPRRGVRRRPRPAGRAGRQLRRAARAPARGRHAR